MKESRKKSAVLIGVALYIVAAIFAISVMYGFLDAGTGNIDQENGLFRFGKMLNSVYGVSSVLIPVFLLVAGLFCFISNWTIQKAASLMISIIPFLTVSGIEKLCRKIAQDPNPLAYAKITGLIILGILLVVAEYLVTLLVAGLVEKKRGERKSKSVEKPVNSYDDEDSVEKKTDQEFKIVQPVEENEEETDSEGLEKEFINKKVIEFEEIIKSDSQKEKDEKKKGPLNFIRNMFSRSEDSSDDDEEETDEIQDAIDHEIDSEIEKAVENSEWNVNKLISEETGHTSEKEEPASEKKVETKSEEAIEQKQSVAEKVQVQAQEEDTLDFSADPWDVEESDEDDVIAQFEKENMAMEENMMVSPVVEEESEADAENSDSFEMEEAVIEEIPEEEDKTEYEIPFEESVEEESPEMEMDSFDMDEAADEFETSMEEYDEAVQKEEDDEPEQFSSAGAQIVDEFLEIEDEAEDEVKDEPSLEKSEGDAYKSSYGVEESDDLVSEPKNPEKPLIGTLSGVFAQMEKDAARELEEKEKGSAVEEKHALESPVANPELPANSPSNLRAQQIDPEETRKAQAKKKRRGPYSIPTDILTAYEENSYWEIDESTNVAGDNLIQVLSQFGIEAQLTGIKKGPVVTLFEILPAPGVRLSKIVNLQDNIALGLAASSVRIIAPIPGKNAVGIEIPNENRAIVSFRECIEQNLPEWKKMKVPVVLGKDIQGQTQIMDLVKTPHLLIAGSTGAGKSVCVNSLILSILYKQAPGNVKMILIDPKVVELKLYNDIPHLLTPVITEPKKAMQSLQYCLCEMERRYALLDGLKCRDISSYNEKIVEEHICTEKLPYIVVIIDEFADLMATAGKQLEGVVARLCAMSRAVGIHLVLATQRPSVDVITGLIKANLPSRIAFMVSSKMDSRVIIDQVGAEKLLGKGDMLYASSTDPFPVRIQGTFISDQEVENVVEAVKEYGEPEYIDDEIFIDEDEESSEQISLFGEGGDDPLYEKALDIVVQSGKASASYLQRRLSIGYNRAARLVELMEERGIVGPANGSKPREIIHMP